MLDTGCSCLAKAALLWDEVAAAWQLCRVADANLNIDSWLTASKMISRVLDSGSLADLDGMLLMKEVPGGGRSLVFVLSDSFLVFSDPAAFIDSLAH